MPAIKTVNIHDAKTPCGQKTHPPRESKHAGDSVTGLILANSHDGSSSFQLDLGLFRLVCSNGMVTPVSSAGGMRFRYGREIVNSVIEGIYDLVDEKPKLAERVDRFGETTLDHGEQDLFPRTACLIKACITVSVS